MPVPTGFRLIGALALAFALSACGAQGAAAPQPGSQSSDAPAADQADQTPFGFLKGLGLTADQATRIRAIAEAARPADDVAQARLETFKALLGAPTLDQAALAAYFREDYDANDASRARVVQMYAAVRDVLTDAQRAGAAKALLAPAPASSPSTQAAAYNQQDTPGVTLTDEQKALFADSMDEPPTVQGVSQALAALMTTGDAGALKATLTPRHTREEAAAAYVKAFASLTPEQRQKLAQ